MSSIMSFLRPLFMDPATATKRLTNSTFKAAQQAGMVLWITLLGPLLMIVGSFLPWAKVDPSGRGANGAAFQTTSIDGFAGARTAVFVFAAVCAIAVLMSLVRYHKAQLLGSAAISLVVVLLATPPITTKFMSDWATTSAFKLPWFTYELGFELTIAGAAWSVAGLMLSMMALLRAHALAVRLYQATLSQTPDASQQEVASVRVSMRQSLEDFLVTKH